MTNSSYDYTQRAGLHPISWNDFHGLCKALAQAVARFDPEIILAVGRGGFYPGTLIAHLLQAEIYPVRLSRRVHDVVQYATPQWLVRPPDLVQGQRILVVDEICSQGETLRLVRDEAERLGAASVRSAVLYAHSWSVAVPDYIGLITDELLLNPWDRELYQDGEFRLHPEYAEALAQQGISPTPDLRIPAPEFTLAKES
jgi:hypoxanthine phosphoribosyltransferase